MAASKTVRNGVAGAIVALAAVALGLMWWAGERAVALQVPITLSLAVDDTVWVSSHGALHELDAEGRRVQRLAGASLGLPAPVLHLHAVRRDDLLVSAGEPMRVLRCTPSQRACRPVDAGYIERFGQFKNAVWLGANADGSRIVVSDNAAHRVAVLDGQSGALLAAAGGSIGRFHYPGQPVWVGENTIWLASADQHRIERFEFVEGAIGVPLQAIALEKRDLSLAGRTWPMALAPLGEGHWWALVKVNMMTAGGLARFDEQGRFTASAKLPEGADLTAVTRLGQHLVAADLEGPALHRLSLTGTDATPFGSDEFQAELRAHGREIKQWFQWQHWAQWALIGAPILGIGVLLLLGERTPLRPPAFDRTAAVAVAACAPMPTGEVVIGLTASYRSLLRRMNWITLPMLVVAPLLFAFAFRVDALPPPLQVMTAVMIALCWGSVLGVLWLTRWSLSRELRVSRDTVSYWRAGRAVASCRLDQCHTDGRSLLVGNETVTLRLRDPVFDAELVQAHILSHLPPERWVGRGRLGWMQYRTFMRVHPIGATLLMLAFALTLALEFVPRAWWGDFWQRLSAFWGG